MQNFVLRNRAALAETNFVRKASRQANYWFDITQNKLTNLQRKRGSNFNIIIFGTDDIEADYYVIPFQLVASILTEETLVYTPSKGTSRWILSVHAHHLRVRHSATTVDISSYYGAPIDQSGNVATLPDDDANDYAIENRLAEIQARQKQSAFRTKVLRNFDSRCCITRIGKPELIVASHIVPWSHQIESRLDPSNGLALFAGHDALFDRGFFTITQNLKVRICSEHAVQDQALLKLLHSIQEVSLERPSHYQIRPEYIEYHQQQVFKG
jgi:hypothetical protein